MESRGNLAHFSGSCDLRLYFAWSRSHYHGMSSQSITGKWTTQRVYIDATIRSFRLLTNQPMQVTLKQRTYHKSRVLDWWDSVMLDPPGFLLYVDRIHDRGHLSEAMYDDE
jgi:hypothetical protein